MKDSCAAARRSKWFLLSCALLFSSATALAQETNDSNKSNIEILKLHWEKEVRPPTNFDPSVIPTGGTFNDPASRTSSAAPTSPLDAVRAATRAQSAAAGGSTAFPDTPARLPLIVQLVNVGDATPEPVVVQRTPPPPLLVAKLVVIRQF